VAVRIRTDEAIQADVLEELKWDSRVRPNEIGVAVKDGIVMLTGWIDSYLKKMSAQEAAHRVFGVKAVANDIEVRVPLSAERTDTDLARVALNALNWDDALWDAGIPTEKIEIMVDHGCVTLKGEVDYYFQKGDAERVIERLSGVRGVSNLVVKARPTPSDLKEQIVKALVRNAQTDASRITVEVQGSEVILRGTVSSYAEKKAAEETACSASGITEVDNRILVSLPV
jgi:osmotically-inducible protein OsmY